ncbi:MAG TPA: LytTR family DNA-binding domain-containing protein [Longimicrobiaceae bacterium]|nr:LytTR family DNA-binding domain-containing protein [Longimicrobiaceae bacterium]
MQLSVLIASGDPATRGRLRALLAHEPEARLVGECADGRAALDLVRRERPDLAFLDAELPGLDGFAVLEAAGPDRAPLAVFVARDGEHALHAFDVQALDCLVEPFGADRFRMAFRRARAAAEERDADREREALQAALDRLAAGGSAPSAPAPRGGWLERLLVRSGDRVLLLRAAEVDWIGAEGNYAELHAGGRTYLIRETMSALEARLDPATFLRVHRSAIVNLDRVRELRPGLGGDYMVTLADGAELRLSRGYRAKLERLQARIATYI